MNETIELIKSHCSIRKFSNRKIQNNELEAIITSAQTASTSSFMQAYTIIQIKDENNRKTIAELSGNQSYIEECSEFLVFCADLHKLELACKMNNRKMDSGFTEAFIIATVDAALAAQNCLVAAESLGLGGVYIGGIRNNPEDISKLLQLPNNVYAVFGLCLGYPDENPDIKPRLPLNFTLCQDKYDLDNKIHLLEAYDNIISQYYFERTNGQRKDGWTGQIASHTSKPLRPHMKTFLKSKDFLIK
jgi:nitroreductase